LNSAQLREGLLGVAAPGFLGALLALLGFWGASIVRRKNEHSKTAKRLDQLGPTLGFAAGYLYIFAIIQTVSFTSPSASAKQIYILLAAVVVAVLESLSTRATKQPMIRWLGRLLIVGGTLYFQYATIRNRWEPGVEMIAWTAGIGLWMMLAFGALDTLVRKSNLTSTALSLAALPMLAIPAIFASGASAQWQIALGLFAAMAGIACVGMIFRERSIGFGVGTIYIAWLSGVFVSGHFLSELPQWHAGVLAAIPFLMLIPELRPKMCRHRRLAIRLAIIAAACITISWTSVPDFFAALTGGGAESEMDYYG
jgi:hypothetical protein